MPRIKSRPERTARKILIGADPELFANDEKGNAVSLHDILPGTKANPVKVPFGAIQVDGIAGEFNIDPAASRIEFLSNISHVRNLLEHLLSQSRSDIRLYAYPTQYLTQEYMNTLPDEVKRLGCEPDYNAYTGKMNPKPDGNVLFRTGAGHIHTGWGSGFDPFEKSHFQTCCALTKEYDFVLYKASKTWDKDLIRMDLYGKPGAFRPKPYGLEYRTLSNAWLRHPLLQQYVYDATRAVSEQFFKGIRLSEKFGTSEITPENEEKYWMFLEKNRIPVIGNYAFSVN